MKILRALPQEAFEQAVSMMPRLRTVDGDPWHFNFATAGELLVFQVSVCEGSAQQRESCGCGRSFSGVHQKSVTIGYVCDEPEDAVRKEFEESPLAQSWKKIIPLADLWLEISEDLSEALRDMRADPGRLVVVRNDEKASHLLLRPFVYDGQDVEPR